jgi:hypothetical protein
MPVGRPAPAPSPVAAMTPEAKRQLVIQVLESAQQSRSMQNAIEKFGKSLSMDDKRILLALTSEELSALQSARTKLKLRQ